MLLLVKAGSSAPKNHLSTRLLSLVALLPPIGSQGPDLEELIGRVRTDDVLRKLANVDRHCKVRIAGDQILEIRKLGRVHRTIISRAAKNSDHLRSRQQRIGVRVLNGSSHRSALQGRLRRWSSDLQVDDSTTVPDKAVTVKVPAVVPAVNRPVEVMVPPVARHCSVG